MKMNCTVLTAIAIATALVPASLSARSPDDAQQWVERQLARAGGALARGEPAAAIRLAEEGVLRAPRDVQARAMLGRAYLAAGRFRSAEMAFGDALALDPSLVRVAVNRAIAQIALGSVDAATATLDAVKGRADASDVGLALALLGHADEARAMLLAAARAPGADARTRQNLAFAYALEGRWNDAAVIAAQDVPAEMVPERLRRWAMVGQLRASPAMQVGAMLGTLPAVDGGQPAALALAADPASPRPPVALAGMVAPPPVPPTVSPPPVAPVLASPSRPEPVVRPVHAFAGPPVMRAARVPGLARARAQRRAMAMPAVFRTSMPVQSGGGRRWSVQLGAYVDPRRIQVAWNRLSARATFLDAYRPTGSGFRRTGALYHRLSIGGFGTRAAAVRLCMRIREVGAQCFVRLDAGERPLQWAIRPRAGQTA